MYAGTGALKTDFTRTGRRTLTGALQDGMNSVTRYYLNNFADGIRQDAYDLLVGNFGPDKRDESPFTFQQQHSLLNLMLEASLATLAVISLSISLRPELPMATRVRDGVLTALALFTVTGYLILKKGKFRSLGRRGKVFLYSRAYFDQSHDHYRYYVAINQAQVCYNVGSMNKEALSANWHGLPQEGKFDGGAKVAFYKYWDCKGTGHAWSTKEQDFPSNFMLDALDKQIQSIAIWVENKNIDRYTPRSILRIQSRRSQFRFAHKPQPPRFILAKKSATMNLNRIDSNTCWGWILLLVGGTALLSIPEVIAWEGEVHFFADTNFRATHGEYICQVSASQECYKASSVQRSGLVLKGNNSVDGKAKIAFFTNMDCGGFVRAWHTEEKNFPINFELDGIDGAVSSFMIWETSINAKGSPGTTSTST
ncbi:hypothetical protein BBJ28_00022073 [Nothophytophthora sp. Chile5]|nr:hypothetical protein BBJ28_00022073 [Nothophytophthora sp. Chile5]